jgi:hypothetical protein
MIKRTAQDSQIPIRYIYPQSWYNVDNKDGKYWIAAVPKVEEKAFPRIFIQSGYYEDGSAFADALNRECHRAFDDLDVKFSFSETLGRFSQWRIQGGGMPGCIPPHQLDTIIYAGIYWRTVATVVVSV